MKITFKEKSFFDEDIDVFDESGKTIANYIVQHGDYFLYFNEKQYFVKAEGSLNYKSEILI